MTGLVVFTVIDVVLLIAGLAFYLYWVGTLLTRIAGNLEECAETVRAIRKTLAATTGGVQAVARLTSTVPDRLTSVNASLKPVRDFCETV